MFKNYDLTCQIMSKLKSFKITLVVAVEERCRYTGMATSSQVSVSDYESSASLTVGLWEWAPWIIKCSHKCCICCLNGRLMLTSHGCTDGVRPPGITVTSMSSMVSGFDVLSCVTFMRSSKLAGFVRLSKQHHYQCLVGVNYIYSGTRYGFIIHAPGILCKWPR